MSAMFKELFEIASLIAQSQFVFSILFIIAIGLLLWMLWSKVKKTEAGQSLLQKDLKETYDEHQNQLFQIMKENEKRSDKREKEIMTHNKTLLEQLNRNNNSLEQISDTMKEMNRSLIDLQNQQNLFQQNTEKEFVRIWENVKKD